MIKVAKKPADYILPLYMNGLAGRMLKAPGKKNKREILLLYGHHASLERWWGLVENLQEYGNVTMPDLPGFGGMESFLKINTRPTLDDFADYLAAFIKLRYKGKRITIVAISFGFLVATRMLQRYPEVVGKTDLVISLVGFVHKSDIVFSARKLTIYKNIARLLATRPISITIRYIGFNKPVLNLMYKHLPWSRIRMLEVTPEQFERTIDFEINLWRANDVRTHWLTTSELIGLDNTKQFVKLPVIHVVSKGDHYLNNISVEQHMRQVFSDYTQFTATLKAHVPPVLADKKAMGEMLPSGLRRLLRKKP